MLKRLKEKIRSLFGNNKEAGIRVREITADAKKTEPVRRPAKAAVREKTRTAPVKDKARAPRVREKAEATAVREKTEAAPVREKIRTAPVRDKEKIKAVKPYVPLKREPKVFEPWDSSVFQVDETEGKVRFHDLDLPEELLRGVYDIGFSYCTDIQAQILPQAFEGRDVSGKAQTGTGKTAAFLIAAFRHMYRNPLENPKPGTPRVLVLAPTRELVLQIEKDAVGLSKYLDVEVLAVFGGMGYEKQKRVLEEKVVEIVVATPGRLLDFRQSSKVNLSKVEILIIDEADRMLDMGFIPDIRKILSFLPPKENRQTMLFSATLTPTVAELASRWTKEPFAVEIEPENVTNTRIEQLAYIIESDDKFKILYNYIVSKDLKSVMVFCNRRDQTRNLTDKLYSLGIECKMLSGDVSQTKRINTLEEFRTGKLQVLVATDVAARGIHVDGVSHVFNYNLPEDPDSYVHRIGRTGRAGASGISVIFACEEEAMLIPSLEEHTGVKMNYIYPDEELLADLPQPVRKPEKKERPVIKSSGRAGTARKTGGRDGGARKPRRSGPPKA